MRFYKIATSKYPVLNMVGRTAVMCLAGYLLLNGCSSGSKLASRRERLMIPAGVDSSVAARSDSLADNLFVSLNQERRADGYKDRGRESSTRSDTLWDYLSNNLRPGFSVTDEASSQAVEAFNEGAKSLQELAALEQNQASMEEKLLKIKIMSLLENARQNFERAVILNPFDLETKSWLAQVYQSLAVRFLDESNNEKGEHTLYSRLAETYYAMEKWQDSYRNFSIAEQVLHSSAGLDFITEDLQQAPVDSSALFYYVYYQGDTQIKLHLSQRGLADLQRALQLASTNQEKSDILSYIDWVNWDGGNTIAVEMRDEILVLQDRGEYNDAAKGFRKLLPKLNTKRAQDETNWRLATLEFQHLQQQQSAVDRLMAVVQSTPKDANGAPADTTYKRYFNSYGAMCHNLGLENMRKNRKFAFMYFQQAVTFEWENRAKSYLEIAKLSRNNPNALIESCSNALKNPEQLDEREQMQAIQLMVEAYKRTGRFEEARKYYTQWMNMRRGGSMPSVRR
jgi:hypothetical protein